MQNDNSIKQIKTFTFLNLGARDYNNTKYDKKVNSWLQRNKDKIENIQIKSSTNYSENDPEYPVFIVFITISYDKVKQQ